MARQITVHKVIGDLNPQLTVEAIDGPGPGGASHEYCISWELGKNHGECVLLEFQQGGIKDVGINGISHEALLAVLVDRLEGFQTGEFACEDNAAALSHLYLALGALQKRTLERIARGVEGKSEK